MVLAVCCLSLFLVGLDTTVVTIALPSIGRDFGAGVEALQWTVGAYTLVMAALLMLAGSLADRLGRRRVFVTGLTIFLLGSLLCGAAPSVGLLVAFRVLQAVGGAMVNPVAVAIITTAFTDPRERAQAVGLRGAVFGVSMALGPIVGGVLSSTLGWRAIFWVNVPLGLACVLLAVGLIPETRASAPRRLDPVGQLLVVVLLTAATYVVIQAPSHGWSAPVIVTALAAAAAALLGLLGYEPRRVQPLHRPAVLPLDPLRVRDRDVDRRLRGALAGSCSLTRCTCRTRAPSHQSKPGSPSVPLAVMVALHLTAVRAPRRAPRPSRATGHRRRLRHHSLRDADRGLLRHPDGLAARRVRRLRRRRRVRQRAHRRHPPSPGCLATRPAWPRALATTARNVGQTLGVAGAGAGAVVASRLGPVGPGDVASATHSSWWLLAACGAVVLLLGAAATTRRAEASAHRVAAQLNPEALSA